MKKRLSVWLSRARDSNSKQVPLSKELIDLAKDIQTTRENSLGRNDPKNKVITVISRIRLTAQTLAANGIDINSLQSSSQGSLSINGKEHLVWFDTFVELEPGFVDDGNGSIEWSPTTKKIRWFFGRALTAAVASSFILFFFNIYQPFPALVVFGICFLIANKFLNQPD